MTTARRPPLAPPTAVARRSRAACGLSSRGWAGAGVRAAGVRRGGGGSPRPRRSRIEPALQQHRCGGAVHALAASPGRVSALLQALVRLAGAEPLVAQLHDHARALAERLGELS